MATCDRCSSTVNVVKHKCKTDNDMYSLCESCSDLYSNIAYPVAKVTKIEQMKTTNYLYVKCPFCAKSHHHAELNVSGKTYFGTRLSHCEGTKKRDYRLMLAFSEKNYSANQ